jgi:hypothetical protein
VAPTIEAATRNIADALDTATERMQALDVAVVGPSLDPQVVDAIGIVTVDMRRSLYAGDIDRANRDADRLRRLVAVLDQQAAGA